MRMRLDERCQAPNAAVHSGADRTFGGGVYESRRSGKAQALRTAIR